jgi:hypothetical protein
MDIIKKLPDDIKKEILYYLIINPKNIIFRDYYEGIKYYPTNYNNKYKIAVINNEKIIKNKEFLSRIEKKNNKHRYYLTKITYINTCNGCGKINCKSRGCRGSIETDIIFSSTYIGKDINNALLYFIL